MKTSLKKCERREVKDEIKPKGRGKKNLVKTGWEPSGRGHG